MHISGTHSVRGMTHKWAGLVSFTTHTWEVVVSEHDKGRQMASVSRANDWEHEWSYIKDTNEQN